MHMSGKYVQEVSFEGLQDLNHIRANILLLLHSQVIMNLRLFFWWISDTMAPPQLVASASCLVR